MQKIDPWYEGEDWKDFAAVLYSPIMQKGLARLINGGLPIGRVSDSTEKEALLGAERRGYFNFYREMVALSLLPQVPPPMEFQHKLVEDPIFPEEPPK